MEIEELRNEYLRLSHLNSIADCLDLFDIFLNYLWNVIDNHHHDEVSSQPDADAKLINQMIFTKTLHLRKITEGVRYIGNNGKNLNPIVDPSNIAPLVRTLYETVAMFNLIYRNTKTPDEKVITYGLWASAGLRYRQRFASAARSKENLEKLADEKRQIEGIEEEIRSTKLFQSLDDKNKKKIESKLKEKDYKILFNGDNVEFLHWHDLANVMDLHEELFENLYSFFSLYAHPSYVSVFQFDEMFSKEGLPFLQLTTTNLKYCFALLSSFIADYIYLFPRVRETFESMSLVDQIVLNAHNKLLRDNDYSINDAWKELG